MQITSYQMHNVLDCYSRQLSKSRRDGKSAPANRQGDIEKLASEPGGKREATLKAVSKDIYNKLTDLASLNPAERQSSSNRGRPIHSEAQREKPGPQQTQFTFNVIDRSNRKTTNQLPVADSSRFFDQLERLEKQAVDKKSESWI